MANEKRLIDANALRTETMAMCGVNEIGFANCYPYWKFDKAINNAPTVDAVEVVHGRWQDCGVGVCCSMCGVSLFHQDENNNWGSEPSGFNYCPNCGAKMDGDGNG